MSRNRILLTTLVILALSAISAAQCALSSTNKTVHICSPASGATVASPVQFSASANDTSAKVTAMAIYLDGTKVYSTASNQLSTSLTVAAGTHKLTVKAWDAAGAVFSTTENFTVSTGGGGGGTCTGSTTNRTVTICTPANNTTVTSPVHITAAATDSASVSSMQIYVDGVKQYQVAAKSIDTNLAMADAPHKITVKAWDSAGSFSSTIYISVQSTPPPPPSGDITSVNHVIFYMHENRSFDSYFGMLNPYRQAKGFTTSTDGHAYSVDGIDDKLNIITNPTDEGQNIALFNTTSSCIDDMTSAWLESYGDVYRWNFSTTRPINMDGFVHIAENFSKSGSGSGTFTDTTGERAMAYYKDTNPDGTPALNYYYYIASQFALSDRWFAPVASKTVPNRIASISGGTTQGYTHDPSNDDNAGQLSGLTIFQLLDQHGISWKIYYEQTNSNGTPTTIFSRFTYANNFIHTNPDGSVSIDSKHIAPISQYYTDVANGTLPSFSYIEKTDSLDEHPGSGTSIFNGQKDTAKILNALMYSPSWKDSVFFFSFDEPGGPYDHVPPVPGHSNDFTSSSLSSVEGDVGPIAVNPDNYLPCVPTTPGVYNNHCDLRSNDPGAKSTDAAAVSGFAAQIGARVPNFIVSPFVKPHYVGHKAMDHTAVLRFLELRYNLPAMTKRDAAQPDLLDFFDFANAPWATPPVQSALPTPPSVGSTCHPDTMH